MAYLDGNEQFFGIIGQVGGGVEQVEMNLPGFVYWSVTNYRIYGNTNGAGILNSTTNHYEIPILFRKSNATNLITPNQIARENSLVPFEGNFMFYARDGVKWTQSCVAFIVNAPAKTIIVASHYAGESFGRFAVSTDGVLNNYSHSPPINTIDTFALITRYIEFEQTGAIYIPFCSDRGYTTNKAWTTMLEAYSSDDYELSVVDIGTTQLGANDYLDFATQKRVNSDETEESVVLPSAPTFDSGVHISTPCMAPAAKIIIN